MHMRIDSETKMEDLGYLLKSNGFSISIEFGSGGYAVTVTDNSSSEEYIEISNDLVEAIRVVFQKAFASKKPKSTKYSENTIPAAPRSKLSIGEISKLLASGSEKNLKLY
jgi:hypothetical protein